MDRFYTICSFQPKTYAGLAKHTARCYSRHLAQQSLEPSKNVHVCAADGLSSTMTVYNHIKKDKNADLAIADSISDALDMCAKDDLIRRKSPLSTSTQTWEVLFQTHDRRLAEEPAIAESVTAKDPNHVDTFGLDFAFSFAQEAMSAMQSGIQDNIWIQEDIAKTSSLSRLEANQHFFNIQQSLPDGATVVPIIISVDKTQLSLISGDRSTPSTLLARFIPTTKIRDPLLKSQVYHYCMSKLLSPLENAAKSGILLACADGRTRQCYPTICAILADYEEQVLLTSVKKNRYCTRCTRCLDKGHDDFVHLVDYFEWKHYNFNIHVSLATDTLHLLLKGLVMKMLDFMQDITTPVTQESSSTQLNERFRQVMHSTSLKRFNNKRAFTEAIIQQLIAVVSPLFVLKAPFALHFIRAVCDLVTLAQYKSHDEDTLAYIQGALERMNVFKEEFRVYRRTLGEEKNFNYPKALNSICTGANSEAHYITIVKQFYSMTNKKEYILQICLHNSQRTALLAADYATVVKQSRLSTTVDIQDRTYSTRVTRPLPFRRLRWSIPGIQPHLTKLPLSEVAANIAISDFTHAAAVCMSVQIHPSIKCWRSSGKRHNDPEHCDEEVVRCAPNWQQTGLWRRDYSRTVTDSRVVAQLYLILTIIDHTCYDKDRKYIAYIGAFSEVLLFNNNGQIDNTTRMLSVPFKFYDLSTIICPVHLVPRDLPDSITHEYNCLYSLTFNIDLLRTLRDSRHHCPLNSSQVRFVLLLLLRRPVRRHYKTPLVLVGLVAHAACRNCADLNPLPPQRRGSLVAFAKTLRGMRPISTNNDSSRHEQQQRPPILRRFSKTNDSTPLLTTES
ncbi:hypothetical protein HBI74_248900 [Parastagonospora nodorum]|nr:hypothetical protein HBI74_248900 [Parastagonospora nodorum]